MAQRLAVLLFAFVLASTSSTTNLNAQTYPQKAADGISQLQTSYQTSTGTWSSPAAWWNWANSVTVLADYERISDDNSYTSALSNTFNVTPGAEDKPNFENNYYDDMGWWALGWVDAYDATNDSSYLSMAETIFSDITNGWDTTTCGGGLWWNTSEGYKNAIPNELFLLLAAKLANRTTGSTSAGYLNWAQTEWNWFKTSGMINPQNLVNDGLNISNPDGCVNNGAETYTYNQGVIVAGLAELYIADQDQTLLPQANAVANAAITTLVDSNGILTEQNGISGTAAPQFKGIFMRSLRELYAVSPSYTYQTFIDNNANSIWSTAQGPDSSCSSQYEFGGIWDAACDQADPIRQTSADDALIAAVAVRGSAFVGPIDQNRYSEQEMFAVDGSGTVWHNWQSRGVDGASDSSNWNGWTSFSMGSVIAQAGPTVVINGVYEQYVFIPTSGHVYGNWQIAGEGDWNGWTDMGSTSNGLTALRALNGLYGMTVFGRDTSGNIWYASQSTPSSSWSTFTEVSGQTVQAGYTVGCNESGLLEIFGVDGSGNVWTNSQTSASAWSGWTNIGGKLVKPYLTVARNLNGNLQIWGVDTSNTDVWTNWQSTNGGSWQSSWQNLGNVGGGVTIQPGFVAGLNANGSLQFFGVGSDGHVHTIWNTSNGWTSSWTQLGTMSLNTYLTAGMTADGRIQLFAVATGSPYGIDSNWQTSSNGYGSASWNGWVSFGGDGYRFYSGQP
jgi:predicted alpha-1,6-mannanase (GH76 family)